MGFQLVPKSATLNDLERHNGFYLRYSTRFASFQAQLHKELKIRLLYWLRL